MRLQNPFAVLSPTGLDSQVLTVMARATQPLSAIQVHSLLPELGSLQGVRNALARLVVEGIVDEHSIGRSLGYTLNREHLLSDVVMQIAGVKRRLIEQIAEVVEQWPVQPLTVKLFGSAARDDMRLDSDIDLLFVMPDHVDGEKTAALVSRLSQRISRWTGNDARPLVYTESEVGPAEIFASILRDGVDISGDRSWLRRAVVRKIA